MDLILIIPITMLGLSFLVVAIGGWMMGKTYEKEAQVSNITEMERLHACGIAVASKIASVAVILLGLAVVWILVALFMAVS